MSTLGHSPKFNDRAPDMAVERARYQQACVTWEAEYLAELTHLQAEVTRAWAHNPAHLDFVQQTWSLMGASSMPPAARYAGLSYLRRAINQLGAASTREPAGTRHA